MSTLSSRHQQHQYHHHYNNNNHQQHQHQHQNHHQRVSSEPHSYNIQAKLRNGVLSIFVHDTVLNLQWRQEFTQISFPGHRLYDVAKVLIMAIQEMIQNTNNNSLPNINDPKPIAILVYNQWCYLTVYNSNLPSFALRPMLTIEHNYYKKNVKKNDINLGSKQKQKQKQKQNKTDTNKHFENYENYVHLPVTSSCSTITIDADPDIASQSSSDFEDVLVLNSDVEEYNTTHSSNDSLFTNDGIIRSPSTDDEERFESDMFESKFYPSCSRFRANKMWNVDTKKKKKTYKQKKDLTILLNGEVIDDMINHVFEQQIAEDEYYDEEDDEQQFYDPNYLGIAPYYDD